LGVFFILFVKVHFWLKETIRLYIISRCIQGTYT